MAAILCTGNATLDIVHTVAQHPAEDEELRALAQRVARGGNAANTAAVLAGLGHAVTFLGTLADDPPAGIIRADLKRRGIHLDACPLVTDSASPLSCITVSRERGTRTIVHHRDLPELGAADFRALDPAAFDWFHFEGRNVPALGEMLKTLHHARVDQPISLEMEKDRAGLEALLPLADVVIVPRALVRQRGFATAEAFAAALRPALGDALLVVTWGEAGAFAFLPDGTRHTAPTFPPPRVVDTVGAGDTFIAGLIDALAAGRPVPLALEAACRLAGRKVGQEGFDHLADTV